MTPLLLLLARAILLGALVFLFTAAALLAASAVAAAFGTPGVFVGWLVIAAILGPHVGRRLKGGRR